MLTSSVLTVFYFCMWCRKNRISISILHQSLKFWFPWQPYHTHRHTVSSRESQSLTCLVLQAHIHLHHWCKVVIHHPRHLRGRRRTWLCSLQAAHELHSLCSIWTTFYTMTDWSQQGVSAPKPETYTICMWSPAELTVTGRHQNISHPERVVWTGKNGRKKYKRGTLGG